ncbi:MAG: carbon-nitrogen hydrolase family protein [Blastocatellia bacterium]
MAPQMVNVAAVQASPVYLSLERSLARALNLIAEAALKNAQLVVFPEAWLPGYPAWLDYCRDVALWDHPPVKKLYARLAESSVVVPGPVTEAIGATAREYNTTVVIGVHERVAEGPGRGTLYNTLLTFGPNGALLNRHRKLMPTFSERLIWGQGDSLGLRAVRTPVGRVGGLMCWEHWMPLTRQVLHDSGEDIHVAAWSSVKEMHQIASRHYAFEGRCFVVAAGAIMHARDLPPELEAVASLTGEPEAFILNGGSAIIGPDGKYLAGPAFDCEALVTARINLERIREENLAMDVTGHYSRPDLFSVQLKTAPGRDAVNGYLPPGPEVVPQTPPEPRGFDFTIGDNRKH